MRLLQTKNAIASRLVDVDSDSVVAYIEKEYARCFGFRVRVRV